MSNCDDIARRTRKNEIQAFEWAAPIMRFSNHKTTIRRSGPSGFTSRFLLFLIFAFQFAGLLTYRMTQSFSFLCLLCSSVLKVFGFPLWLTVACDLRQNFRVPLVHSQLANTISVLPGQTYENLIGKK
jgi:hypothetical protein